ncbi:MAG: alpha/beta fold hydrolase [Candidatus Buchananbacteria bacterium]|nr:alpha/beta fold hydrolase [Candidatus Buchananbacteria bacterium]
MKEKPVLVFIHGMFCTEKVFSSLAKFFKQNGFTVMAVRLPFHDVLIGEQPPAELGTTSILDYVEYLKEIVIKINSEYILLGHSMGGLICSKLVSQPDINPKGMVLLAPAVPRWVIALKPSVLKSFKNIITTKNFWNRAIHMSFEEICYSMLNMVPDEDRLQIYRCLTYESGRAGFELGFWAFDTRKATKLNYKNITCPIVVFAGTEDNITPVSVISDFVKKLDKKSPAPISFHVLEGKGHWLVTELDPQLILEEIEKIIETEEK